MRNQCARPRQTAVVRNGVAAIDRPAAVRKPTFLKYANQEILVCRSAGNVGLGLSSHGGGQRRRIIAQSNVWAEVLPDRPEALLEAGFVGQRQPTQPPKVTMQGRTLSILKL